MRQFTELDDNWKRLLFDESPIAMALVDSNHRFLRCNDAYCRLVGFGRSELINRTTQSITHPDDSEGDTAGAESLRLDPHADLYTITKRYLSKNGEIVWANLHVRAVRDGNKFHCFYVIAIPITHANHEIAVVQQPQGLIDWLKSHPRDAVFLGGAAVAIFGRDAVIELVKVLLTRS